MTKFFARFAVVTLAAGLIVGVGFTLQHVQPVAAFFSKDGRADGTDVARPGESKPTPADTPSADSAAASTASGLAGTEAVHPDEDKTDFERWPDVTDTAQLFHALRIMLPIAAVVVAFDVIRRRSRNKRRLGATKQFRGAQ